jgi:hypothetical protein
MADHRKRSSEACALGPPLKTPRIRMIKMTSRVERSLKDPAPGPDEVSARDQENCEETSPEDRPTYPKDWTSERRILKDLAATLTPVLLGCLVAYLNHQGYETAIVAKLLEVPPNTLAQDKRRALLRYPCDELRRMCAHTKGMEIYAELVSKGGAALANEEMK